MFAMNNVGRNMNLKMLQVRSQENEKHVTRNGETRLKCVTLGGKQNWYGK